MRSVPCRSGGWSRRGWSGWVRSLGFRSRGSLEAESESRSGEIETRPSPEARSFRLLFVLAGMMGKAEGPSVRIGATDRKVRRRRCWFDKIFRS